jgi:hypothetical protein
VEQRRPDRALERLEKDETKTTLYAMGKKDNYLMHNTCGNCAIPQLELRDSDDIIAGV